ncbi:hypothetical protein COOONC_05253 [Cooperia oncophora]
MEVDSEDSLGSILFIPELDKIGSTKEAMALNYLMSTYSRLNTESRNEQSGKLARSSVCLSHYSSNLVSNTLLSDIISHCTNRTLCDENALSEVI